MRGRILFCFVLERELLLFFLAIEEQNCIWYGWNAFLFLLYLMEGVNCVEGGRKVCYYVEYI